MTLDTSAQPQPQAPPRPRPRSLWRDAAFLRFWAGQSISVMGTQVTTFAVPVMIVTTMGATASQVGLARFMQTVPYLFLTLPVGLWVDRHPARRAMLAANVIRGVVIATIAILGGAGVLRLDLLYVLLLAVGAFTAVFDVSYQSYLPVLVRRDQLVDGNSKLSVSDSAAQVAGPGLGGLLVQALTAPIALVADAISYAVSVVTLLTLRGKDEAGELAPPAEQESIRRRLAAGLGVVMRNPYLRILGLESLTYNFFVQFNQTLVVIYAIRHLGLTVGALGLAISIGGLGSVAGAMVARKTMLMIGFGPAFIAGTALACVAPILLPLATRPHSLAIALIATFYLLAGFGVTISIVGAVTLRQTVTPRHLLGRVNAAMRLASYGAVPLGSLAAGGLAATAGVRGTLFIGVAGLALPVLILMLSPIPRLRTSFAAAPEADTPA